MGLQVAIDGIVERRVVFEFCSFLAVLLRDCIDAAVSANSGRMLLRALARFESIAVC